jgi:hypothetical protein
MKRTKWTGIALALATFAAAALHAQEPAPKGAFKAVHLVTLAPSEEASLRAALVDVNAAIAKAGHPEIRYQLFRIAGKQAGNYNLLWESSWPSGAVYDQVHNSPAFQETTKKHPEIEELRKAEVYNRYTEVAIAKPQP